MGFDPASFPHRWGAFGAENVPIGGALMAGSSPAMTEGSGDPAHPPNEADGAHVAPLSQM